MNKRERGVCAIGGSSAGYIYSPASGLRVKSQIWHGHWPALALGEAERRDAPPSRNTMAPGDEEDAVASLPVSKPCEAPFASLNPFLGIQRCALSSFCSSNGDLKKKVPVTGESSSSMLEK